MYIVGFGNINIKDTFNTSICYEKSLVLLIYDTSLRIGGSEKHLVGHKACIHAEECPDAIGNQDNILVFAFSSSMAMRISLPVSQEWTSGNPSLSLCCQEIAACSAHFLLHYRLCHVCIILRSFFNIWFVIQWASAAPTLGKVFKALVDFLHE